jgi:hypothetical protein
MRLGMFPVHAQTADGTRHDTVRVYATDDTTELWGLTGGQPAIITTGAGLVKQARSVGERFADGTKAKWTLHLADGAEWLLTPAGGCGCGHKLKTFDPSKAVRT